MMSSTSGFSQGRYLRLIAISTVEVFGTIPLATFFIVSNAKSGMGPWKSWADTHSHYSVVYQIAGFVWKNNPTVAMRLEIYRWSLVACAFIFFALFGFAVEACEQYYRLYKLLARCIGYSTSASHGAPHTCVSLASLCWYISIYWGLNLFVPVLHRCHMKRETDLDSDSEMSLRLFLSLYQRRVDTRIAFHSPINLRCCPFPRGVPPSIPILPPSKIRIRTPCHFTTLRKASMNRTCRASRAPRRGSF